MRGRLLWLVLGIVVGVAGSVGCSILWARLMGGVTIAGILQYEPPVDPSLTATYPTGHFVETRVYLDDASPEDVGRTIYATGAIGGTPLGGTPRYPMLSSARVMASGPIPPPAP